MSCDLARSVCVAASLLVHPNLVMRSWAPRQRLQGSGRRRFPWLRLRPFAEVQQLVLDSGELKAITGSVLPADRFSALEFRFKAGALLLRCDDDTDEVLVDVVEERTGLPPALHDLFLDLVGSTIDCAWVMTNHLGYDDAFQLRLATAEGRFVIVQFEVGASAMDVRRIVE